jgi:capsular polysaccharide biosynthesis protein
LGRRGSVATRVSNQEEIQSVFSDYGFEIVYPEELSLEQSIELFSQAKIIAGATGAAMTNIIFAPKNTVVLCLLGENTANNTIFSNIAGIIGQQMIYILGKSNRDSAFSYHSSFRINPVDVLNCLNLIFKKQGLRRDSN